MKKKTSVRLDSNKRILGNLGFVQEVRKESLPCEVVSVGEGEEGAVLGGQESEGKIKETISKRKTDLEPQSVDAFVLISTTGGVRRPLAAARGKAEGICASRFKNSQSKNRGREATN